jgi:hypothetical protein
LYVLGAMLVVIGTVLQDVVADAMSTEVVPRTDSAGNERSDDSVRVELGMVQVMGRLAVTAGVLAVAGLSGWLASFMRRQDVFLLGYSAAASYSALLWWCWASAAFRSGKRSSSSSRRE